MDPTKHHLFDKRQRKPRIISDKTEGQDYTLVPIKNIKYGKAQIHYWPPNLSAIYLKIAKENFQKASEIHRSFIKPMDSKNEEINLTDEETVLFYDYIEHMQLAIIMICTAIESVVNGVIPSNYIYIENFKGTKKEHNYYSIQRNVSLIDKLSTVLLNACNIKLKGESFWSKFKNLNTLRNELIHMKSLETSSVYDQRQFFEKLDETIVDKLVSDKAIGFAQSGFDLLYSIYSQIQNRTDLPILYDTEDLMKEEVDDILNHFTILNRQ